MSAALTIPKPFFEKILWFCNLVTPKHLALNYVQGLEEIRLYVWCCLCHTNDLGSEFVSVTSKFS